MASKVGIENLKAVLDLALAGVEVGVAVSADGKVGFDDLAQLGKLVPVLPAAIGAIGQLPSEVSDLDSEEAAELVAHIMGKLAIESEKAKAVIGASFKMLAASVELYKAIKS